MNSSCKHTEPSEWSVTLLGGNGWGSIPQTLIVFSIFTMASLFIYILKYYFFGPQSAQSLLNLACGKGDQWLKVQKGNAALQYIHFQRMMFFIALMYLVISMISLSINLSGNQGSGEFQLYQTTIANLGDNSPFHYFSIIAAFILPWLVLMVVSKYMSSYMTRRTLCRSCEGSSTLVMKGLIKDPPSDSDIEQYYSATYPRVKLLYITRVQDTRYLRKLILRLNWVLNIINDIKVKEKVDTETLKIYIEKETRIRMIIRKEQIKLKNCKDFLGIVFLTFRSNIEVEKIVIMEELKSNSMYSSIEQAPCPHDILWGNMRSPSLTVFLRLSNVAFLLLVSTFATSPAAFSFWSYQKLEKTLLKENQLLDSPYLKWLDSPYLKKIVPNTLFLIFSLVMPYVVKIFTVYFGHWSMTKVISQYMVRLFFWLLLTIIIFPLLTLTNMSDILKFLSNLPLIKDLLNVEETDDDSFKCMLIPKSGAFFVNHLTLSALFRNQLQLHRLGDNAYVLWMVLIHSCSRHQRKAALDYSMNYCRNLNTYENMALSQHYTWIIIHFAILSCFCLICPLVSPAFLLYLVTKHLVDLQNFRICYYAKEEQPMLHRTAAQLLIFCPLLGQLCITVVQLTNKDQEEDSLLSLTAGTLLTLNFFLFFFIQSSGWTFPVDLFKDWNKDLFGENMKLRRRYYEGEVYEDPAMSMIF